MTSPHSDIILSDFAEHFDLADVETEPGTVTAIDQDGNLRPSIQPYDKKVAGVVSGAGNFRPAIVLGKQEQSSRRMAIALVGKVYCKVDFKLRSCCFAVASVMTSGLSFKGLWGSKVTWLLWPANGWRRLRILTKGDLAVRQYRMA
jgi:hypothetical protein